MQKILFKLLSSIRFDEDPFYVLGNSGIEQFRIHKLIKEAMYENYIEYNTEGLLSITQKGILYIKENAKKYSHEASEWIEKKSKAKIVKKSKYDIFIPERSWTG